MKKTVLNFKFRLSIRNERTLRKCENYFDFRFRVQYNILFILNSDHTGSY